MNEKCPNCGAIQMQTVDGISKYEKICGCCGYVVEVINKQDYVSKFECPDCGSLSGTLEENDYKLGVRCNKCDKLHIKLEKQTTVNRRNVVLNQSTQSNLPKCPMCGSTNISKISTLNRATSIIGFGILSKKIGKQWQCNNPKCKHLW